MSEIDQNEQHLNEVPKRYYEITRNEFIDKFIDPWDLEQVTDEGMLDRFFVDDISGYDALLHIFCGETSEKDGTVRSFGFHLESTAPSKFTKALTVPERKLTKASKPRLQKRDFEPYNVPVVIQTYEKGSRNKVKISGGKRIDTNTMFGRAYDAFSIIRTLVDAVDNRNPADDISITERNAVRPGLSSKCFIYDMPILGVSETAPIKIVLEAKSDKIISASPILPANYTSKLGSISMQD